MAQAGDRFEIRLLLAAAVTSVIAFALILYTLLTRQLEEEGWGSGIALLFILPTIVLLYDSSRRKNRRLLHADTAAILILFFGEFAADVGARMTVAGGSLILPYVVVETFLFASFYAGYLVVRHRILRVATA